MNCMKCGRELQDQKVFCQLCLEDMEKYPVKPGTLILLPQQAPAPVTKKKPAKVKRALKPEEQLARTRSSLRLLVFALLAVLAAFALTVLMLLHTLNQRDAKLPDDGKTSAAYTEIQDVSRETSLPI